MGTTAFYRACKFNNLATAKQLYNEGVNWKLTDNEGRSPLWEASFSGHDEIVKFLIKLGADVNEQHVSGNGPLHAAASKGQLETARILLANKANPNLKNKWGLTPHYGACERNHSDVAKLLDPNGC